MSQYSPGELYAWCVAHDWFEQSELDEDIHYQRARIEMMMNLNRIAKDGRWM